MQVFKNHIAISLLNFGFKYSFHNRAIVLLLLTPLFSIGQHRSYYDKYEYRKKRHEINFGLGASGTVITLKADNNIFQLNEVEMIMKHTMGEVKDALWKNGYTTVKGNSGTFTPSPPPAPRDS